MAKKISVEDKLKYQEEIKRIKGLIVNRMARLTKLEKDINEDSYSFENYYHIAISNEHLEICRLSCEMSKTSEVYMKKKNDDFLNDARKTYFKALIEFEKFLGNFVDEPLHEKQEILKSLDKLNPKRVLNIIKKLQIILKMIEDGYGENSKYKWSFVDMYGRYVTIFKNLLDYKRLSINSPTDAYFAENVELLNMIKIDLQAISHKFREKYMLGTKEVVDIKQAINFQEALRKINSLLGSQEEVGTSKKTIESWNQMLNKEEEIKEQQRKRAIRNGQKN